MVATQETPTVRTHRRSPWRTAGKVLGLVLVVALVAVISMYPRQLWSLATHWKGGASTTWAVPPETELPVLRMAVAGDIGDSGRPQTRIAAAMADLAADRPYDVLLLLGDNVYPHGDPTQLPTRVFGPFSRVLDAGTELRAILGNHDVKEGHGDDQLARLGMPGRWWAKEYGDVLLVGLDSTSPRDPEQLAFLEQALATTTATWRIVALHHPPYSGGYQGSNRLVREVFTPLFTRYDVQLVLSGHDHDYQRTVPLAGVTYLVSGAGAGTRLTDTRSFTAVAYAEAHYVDLAVFPDRLRIRAVTREGRLFDEAELAP